MFNNLLDIVNVGVSDNASGSSAMQPDNQPVSSPTISMSAFITIILIAVAIIVLLVVLVIHFSTKKKREPKTAQTQYNQNQNLSTYIQPQIQAFSQEEFNLIANFRQLNQDKKELIKNNIQAMLPTSNVGERKE